MSFCTSLLPAFAGSFLFAVPIFGVKSKIFRNYKIYPDKFVIVSVPIFGVKSKIPEVAEECKVKKQISVPSFGAKSKMDDSPFPTPFNFTGFRPQLWG